MAGREVKKLQRELRDAAMVFTMAGAGLASLQAGQDRALAETELAVRQAIANARNAGHGTEVDAMLADATSHRDFLGKDKTDWLAFLGRLESDEPVKNDPPAVQPLTTTDRSTTGAATSGAATTERATTEGATTEPEPQPSAVKQPQRPAASAPQQRQPQWRAETQASTSETKWSGLLVIPILVLGMVVVGPWIVNKVITRSSAEVGRCYDSLKAISGGQFDEVECDDPSAMRLFTTGTPDQLRTSSTCPRSSLTVIIDRPDTAYCLAPAYLGEAQAPATSSTSAPTTLPPAAPSTSQRAAPVQDLDLDSDSDAAASDASTDSEEESAAGSTDDEQATLQAPTDLRCAYTDIVYAGTPERAVSYKAEWTWTDRSDGELDYHLWSQASRFELGPDAESATLVSSEGNWTVMTSLDVVGPGGQVVTIIAPSCEAAGGLLPPPPAAETTTTTVAPTTTTAASGSLTPEELATRLMDAANRNDRAAAQELAPAVGAADLDRFMNGAPYVFEGCFDGSQPECSMFSDSLYVNVGTTPNPPVSITYIGFFTG